MQTKEGGVLRKEEWGVSLRKNNKLPLIWLRAHAASLSHSLRLHKCRMWSIPSDPHEDTCCFAAVSSIWYNLVFLLPSIAFFSISTHKCLHSLLFPFSILSHFGPFPHNVYDFLSVCVHPTLPHHALCLFSSPCFTFLFYSITALIFFSFPLTALWGRIQIRWVVTANTNGIHPL